MQIVCCVRFSCKIDEMLKFWTVICVLLAQMWMLKLTELVFILILVPYSKGRWQWAYKFEMRCKLYYWHFSGLFANAGNDWTIKVEKSFNVTRGSTLTIPCTFTYPRNEKVEEVFWKTNGRSKCNKDDNDKRAFVFHPNSSCVLPKYKKTNLIGNKLDGDCSLEIANIQESGKIYMRLITSKNKYSFKNDQVVISVNG